MVELTEVMLQRSYEGGKGPRIMGNGLQYGMDAPGIVIAAKTDLKVVSSCSGGMRRDVAIMRLSLGLKL